MCPLILTLVTPFLPKELFLAPNKNPFFSFLSTLHPFTARIMDQEEFLVEERDEEMVILGGSQEPIKRKAWFLKPTSRISSPPFSPSLFKGIPKTPRIHFKGWASPQQNWQQWVDKLKPKHGALWRELGIYDSITASTYAIRRDLWSIFGLLSFWCEETNTFIFPWAETTVTLEDVMILGGFSAVGEPVRVRGDLEGEMGVLESAMLKEVRKFNQTKCKRPSMSLWIKHYLEEGDGGVIEHIALLSLWLSRFVLSTAPERTVGWHVIPIAIRLAKGVKIALAPAVLASLYRDFRKLKVYLDSNGDEPLLVWAAFSILQVWIWERFVALRPEPSRFVGPGEPRIARWHEVVCRKLDFSLVMSVLESPDEFRWRPYTIDFDHWNKPSFYKDSGEWISGNGIGDDLRSFAQCLRSCELVGLDCIEQYLPHRVSLQFGMDQDVPESVPRVNLTWEIAWKTYDIYKKNFKFYIAPRLFESDITLRYAIWWKNVDRILTTKKVPKKRKAALSLTCRKMRKLQEIYDSAPSDRFAHRAREISCEDVCIASQEQLACAVMPGMDVSLKIEFKFKKEEYSIVKYKESEVDLKIKRLKEEIASIQARIMELESLGEVDTKPELVSFIS